MFNKSPRPQEVSTNQEPRRSYSEQSYGYRRSGPPQDRYQSQGGGFQSGGRHQSGGRQSEGRYQSQGRYQSSQEPRPIPNRKAPLNIEIPEAFSSLGIGYKVGCAIVEKGYLTPTPVQTQAIPVVIAGKDLFGLSQTGTGKTAAYCLPIIENLIKQDLGNKKTVTTLILAPTRELALQIQENFRDYGKYCGITCALVCGGMSYTRQIQDIRRGVDVLIATPGRLMDLLQQNVAQLDQVSMLVLDEADRMLDMGFSDDILAIVALLPEVHQTLMFSATRPRSIQGMITRLLRQPVEIQVANAAVTKSSITQSVYFVKEEQKSELLTHLFASGDMGKSLIFTKTKMGADHLNRDLMRSGQRTEVIHGDKPQRMREQALRRFRDGHVDVLVASDVASRGIDVQDITHVINFDMPNCADTYVHRIGRTGRGSAEGLALSFCNRQDLESLIRIEREIKQDIPIVSDHPFHEDRFDLEKKALAGRRMGRGGGRGGPPSRGRFPARRFSSEQSSGPNRGGGAPSFHRRPSEGRR
jgi:ATP-dependent RNA helicase RhlE